MSCIKCVRFFPPGMAARDLQNADGASFTRILSRFPV
jgi:hypothetical protein